MNRLSIRTRITAGSLVIAALLLVVGLIVVRAQVSSILSTADTTLAESDLTSFQKDITANPDETVDDPGTGVLVYVRSPAGVVEVSTLPHDVLALVDRRAPTEEEFAFTDDEGRSYTVVGRTVTTIQGTWALWSARSTSSSTLALEGLDGVLIVGGLLLLVGFGAASWMLASAALRPVSTMRKEAESLSPSGRLAVPRTKDELADLAQTLNRLLGNVEESTTREKQMVSDAAHELRTPLASLKTQLELGRRDRGDADALARHLEAAETSVDRLTSLASNLLELSRLEGQERPPSSTTAELVDEFTTSVDRARTLGIGKELTIDFTVGAPSTPSAYAIDAQAFGRLVDNLLTNAIHAVTLGGTITTTLTEADTLHLTVVDDGPGVPDEFLPVAFERFTRPDASRTSSSGGSGLGLAVVQTLARSAGGSATLENRHPGLAVTVTLPKM